jgi:hypothetical protein
MSVEGIRNSRIAACCLLAMFAVTATPVCVMAQEVDNQTYYDFELPPEGMLCTDNMIEEPYTDELEPTPAAHNGGGCVVPDLPIST